MDNHKQWFCPLSFYICSKIFLFIQKPYNKDTWFISINLGLTLHNCVIIMQNLHYMAVLNSLLNATSLKILFGIHIMLYMGKKSTFKIYFCWHSVLQLHYSYNIRHILKNGIRIHGICKIVSKFLTLSKTLSYICHKGNPTLKLCKHGNHK